MLKLFADTRWVTRNYSAAFGRLCVETNFTFRTTSSSLSQPPSGGCVLKLLLPKRQLKKHHQPPSGGCVLKQNTRCFVQSDKNSAAFGRLCVETTFEANGINAKYGQPPSGGCVLKRYGAKFIPVSGTQPPSGGCVLKQCNPF